MKRFLKIVTTILTLSAISIIIVLNYHNQSVNYVQLYGTFILLGVLILLRGICLNDEKEYKRNFYLYFLIYIAALFGTIFMVQRGLSTDYFFEFDSSDFQLIPFHYLISTIIEPNLYMRELIFNYLGNFLMLVPLTLFLAVKDKKYLSYKRMFIVLFFVTFIIEVAEVVFDIGMFDIDDFILNILGGMLLLIILKKTKLLDFFKRIFYTDLKLKKWISISLLIITAVILILLDIGSVMEISKLRRYGAMTDYLRGLPAERQVSFTLDGYDIYIDNLLVVYKISEDEMYELDETIKEHMNYDDIIESVEFIDETEEYRLYRGEEVNLYECKGKNMLVLSGGTYKEDYCR